MVEDGATPQRPPPPPPLPEHNVSVNTHRTLALILLRLLLFTLHFCCRNLLPCNLAGAERDPIQLEIRGGATTEP